MMKAVPPMARSRLEVSAATLAGAPATSMAGFAGADAGADAGVDAASWPGSLKPGSALPAWSCVLAGVCWFCMRAAFVKKMVARLAPQSDLGAFAHLDQAV